MANYKRREERVCAALPVNLGTACGITCDISASGIFFETNSSLTPGSPINFTVEFDGPGGKMELKCSGEIVRTEPRDTRVGVAVKIIESAMGLALQREKGSPQSVLWDGPSST